MTQEENTMPLYFPENDGYDGRLCRNAVEKPIQSC